MDLIKKCVLFVLLLHAGAALEVSAPTTYMATMGPDKLIPCEYTIENPPVDPGFFAAFWFFQGKEILSYDNEVRATDSRYSLDTEKALQGRVDLSISDMSVSDAGVYTCSVLYSPVWKKKDIIVDVKAPPQVTITSKTVNKKSVLRCSVTGFYPAGIEIKWFRGSERLSDVTEDPPSRNLDGTYSVNSTVTITSTEEDQEQNVSCRVQHESLKKPLQEDFQLGYTDNSATAGNQNLIIIAGAVGILIIIVILIVIYCKCKKQKIDHNPNTENTVGTRDISSDSNGGITAELKIGDIIVPDLILNNRAKMKCPIYNYKLGEHTVEWYEKKQDAEELIPKSDQRRIQTERQKNNTLIAYLALTPVKREDDKIKYICKVKGSRQMVEASASTKELRVTEQKSILKNKKEKSPKSPEKDSSQNTPDHDIEVWGQRRIKALDKERTPPSLKKLGKEGFQSLNESSQIKEIKIPQIFSETAAQQETKELRNSYGHKITQRPENAKGPGNELPGEEEMEEHSLSTNKTSNEKKMQPLEKSYTNTEKEGVNQEKGNHGTSHLITDLFTPQEIIASIGSSTGEGEEEMINIRESLTKEGSDTEETSDEWRPTNREGEPLGDRDNEETSQLIHSGASSNKEGAGLKEISTEWRPENSEEGPPGESDNEETSQLIQSGASSNTEGAGLKEISKEWRLGE